MFDAVAGAVRSSKARRMVDGADFLTVPEACTWGPQPAPPTLERPRASLPETPSTLLFFQTISCRSPTL